MKEATAKQIRTAAVIGADLRGLVAAFELSRSGVEVCVYESSERAGGAAALLRVGEETLDAFPFVLHRDDEWLMSLIRLFGFEARIQWCMPSFGVSMRERILPVTELTDLMRLASLPASARIRLIGMLTGLRKPTASVGTMTGNTARDAATGRIGAIAYDQLIRPILAGPFDFEADMVDSSFLQTTLRDAFPLASSPDRRVTGYLDGGFGTLCEEIVARLRDRRCEVRFDAPAYAVRQTGDGFQVEASDSRVSYDAVLFSGAPMQLAGMSVPMSRDEQAARMRVPFLSAVSVLLELERPISNCSTIHVCDGDLPFSSVVEHTHAYGMRGYGSHVVYLTRHLYDGDPLSLMNDEELSSLFLKELARIRPMFSDSDLRKCTVNRIPYARAVFRAQPGGSSSGEGALPVATSLKTGTDGFLVVCAAQRRIGLRDLDADVELGFRAARTMLRPEEN